MPDPKVRSVEAPNGWTLWYADEKTAKVAKQVEPFKAPRAGVITPAKSQPDDRDGLVDPIVRYDPRVHQILQPAQDVVVPENRV